MTHKISSEIKKVNGLIENILFGPVQSRRFGVSLGINLLPPTNKICSFNCPYCECGWTDLVKSKGLLSELKFPEPQEIYSALESCLKEYKKENDVKIQHITLAGNGEPTMHPQFAEIIYQIRKIVDKFYPEAKFVLLTNGIHLDNLEIQKCLPLIDSLNVKLDAADEKTYKKMNGSIKGTFADLLNIIKQLKTFNIQAMFLDGIVSNISPEHIEKWIKLVCELKPKQVQIYTIERSTPADKVTPIKKELLEKIRDQLIEQGIDAKCY